MIQNLLLAILIILCILLIISIFRKPFDDTVRNPCRFKILPPKYTVDGNKKLVSFYIIVERKHRYFINFPLSFKFYSDQEFRTDVRIHYTVPGDKKQKLLEKIIEFSKKTKEYVVYITDVIMGKILIEVEMEVQHGNPSIAFEILENSTCDLTKEHKLEIKFPE